MLKYLISLVMLSASFLSIAQPVKAGETPRATIDALFDAMRAGDSAAIEALWVEGSHLDRRRKNGAHSRGLFTGWATAVGNYAAGDLDEQIFDVTVQQYGGIAQVHAPFVIYVKGKLAGCGVNQFALVNIEGDWKVSYGMDTQHDGDCATFRDTYKPS